MPGLEDLYREIILDHYKNPRNEGELPSPPAIKEQGFNPLCGDEISVYINVKDDVIEDIKIAGQGCSISRSSASLMSVAVKGKTLSEAEGVIGTFKAMMFSSENNGPEELDQVTKLPSNARSLGELIALQGVVKFPVRIKCATLAWNTLALGIQDARAV